MTGVLAWRVRAPLAAALLVSVAALVQTLGGASPGQLWALAVYLVVMYSVAAHATEGRAALGGAVVVAGLFVQEWADHGSDYLFIVLVFGGTWLLGRAVLTWRSRAVRAVAEANDKARLAVAEERLRLARELHDVVAHSLGVIAVQAEAAHAALDRDADLARAPVAAVLAQARGAITEMRQLLGVLRTDDEALRGPQPGLADLGGTGRRIPGRGTSRPAPDVWPAGGAGADRRPRGLPDRAGGPDQRPQARGHRAHERPRRALRVRRSRSRW